MFSYLFFFHMFDSVSLLMPSSKNTTLLFSAL
jgi:hypothetical protein